MCTEYPHWNSDPEIVYINKEYNNIECSSKAGSSSTSVFNVLSILRVILAPLDHSQHPDSNSTTKLILR